MELLDYRSPLSNHPLNRGLTSRWQVLPGWRGGLRFRDLCHRNHGTLTNMDPAVRWSSNQTKSGFGSLTFDASNDYIDCGHIAALDGSTKATFGGWMYRATTGTQVCFGRHLGDHRLNVLWASDGNVYTQVENGGLAFPFFANAETGWHHYLCCYDGSLAAASRVRVYWDGVVKTAGSGGDPATSISSSAGTIWRLGNTDSRFTGGALDGIVLWAGRTLTDAEAKLLYRLECQRFNPLLRWLELPQWAASEVASAFPAAYFRTLQQHLGA